jgi:hypothetical protein
MTDEDIAAVLRTSPEGVRKGFYRDALKERGTSTSTRDDDGVLWED